MNDVSIKVLDALFDLCEGEGYRILEAEEITSRVSFHTFLPDELTEILEVLVADGLIELKYADNREYCVEMKTKGRALIKQSRERLSKLVAEEPEILSYKKELEEAAADRRERAVLEEQKERLQSESEERIRQAQKSYDAADSLEKKQESQAALESAMSESKRQQEKISELDDLIRRNELREKARTSRSLINAMPKKQESDKPAVNIAQTPVEPKPSSVAVENSDRNRRSDPPVDPKKVFLFALLGSAIGAAIVNLIFMILIFNKI